MIFNSNNLNNFIDYLIEEFLDEDIAFVELKKSIMKILQNLSDISALINFRKGNTMDLFSIAQASIKNEELNNLLHFKIDESLSISDAEKILKDKTKSLIDILRNEETCLRPYLLAGVAIKDKQLREAIMNIGYTPDLKGNIVSKPINTSFLLGLNEIQDLYNKSTGTRKALILNYKSVKASGYLTRKLSLLTVDTKI